MIAFYIIHFLLILFGIIQSFHIQDKIGNFIIINPLGPLTLIATSLSLLRISIGRILLRIVAFLVVTFIIGTIFWAGQFEWIKILNLIFYGYIYLSFGPHSWWYNLYSPTGLLSRESRI